MNSTIMLLDFFRKATICICFILVYSSCTNQATKAYKKGMSKMQQGEYNYSIEYFKLSIDKGGNKGRLNYLIAENYRQTNRILEAKKHYEIALAAGVKEDRATYYYAQALKASGNYFDAKIMFDKYVQTGANKVLVNMAQKESDFISKIDSIRNLDSYYKVKNLGSDINTEGPEYAPIYKNGEIIYTASNNQFEYTAIGSGFTDIYTFKFDGTTETSGIKKSYGEKINKNKTHEACPAISPDGNTIIFVRSNDGKRKGSVDTDLYFTELRDEVWSDPKIISSICDSRSWESTPALSPDGKTLYFASNKKGGYGGIDLYKSNWSDSAGWMAPINLGPSINTSGNEMFPYVSQEGIFYFSSDGHPGLGRLDIFMLKPDSSSNNKGIILNLGPDINSNADDFGINFKDKSTGYFSSNREGGKGDDDIYSFVYEVPPPKPVIRKYKDYLTVLITTHDISDTKDTLKVYLDSAIVELRTDSAKVFDSTFTNKDGMATFAIDSTFKAYIYAEKKGYFANTIYYNLKDNICRKDSFSRELTNRYYSAKLNLQKIKVGKEIVLEHIYYDYNKADIRTDVEPDLMLVVEFMKKNPGVYIELGAHTDSRGNDAYNLKLSKARAQSAVDFIVKHGIEQARIKPIGYGETKHIIKEATTEEEHQINRRTEFHIIDVKN